MRILGAVEDDYINLDGNYIQNLCFNHIIKIKANSAVGFVAYSLDVPTPFFHIKLAFQELMKKAL